MTKIFYAQDLKTGEVVYLTIDGAWSPDAAEAAVARTPEEENALRAAAEKDAAANRVFNLDRAEVEAAGNLLQPARRKDAIRAKGPSVRPDLGKQARAGGR